MMQKIESSANAITKRLQEIFIRFLKDAAALCDDPSVRFLRENADQIRELQEATTRPFNLTVFGFMKAGKSSLVNALVASDCAVVGCEETTATINVLSKAGSGRTTDKFIIHWKDGTEETVPVSRLASDWTGKTDDVIDRVRRTEYLQMFSDSEILRFHELVDSPGLGSSDKTHEAIAQQFLSGRKSDALIYVFRPNGEEADKETLEKFADSRPPGSPPYNSVGVLHRWDQTYWDARGDWHAVQEKADRLKDHLGGLVKDVIPVSAPLSMLAARASCAHWAECLRLANNKGNKDIVELLHDLWDWDDDDSSRMEFRKSLDSLFPSAKFPDECFRVLVLEAMHLGPNASPEDLRNRIAGVGGLDKLRAFLDKHFFARAAVLRQKGQFARFRKIADEISEKLEVRTSVWRSDPARRVAIGRIEKAWLDFDRLVINSDAEKLLEDLDALDWCEKNLSKDYSDIVALKALVEWWTGDKSVKLDLSALKRIKSKLTLLRFGILDPPGRKAAGHLLRRIDSVFIKMK